MAETVEQAAAQGDGRSLSPALEPHWYLDPAVLEREQRAIFERTWQLAGHLSELDGPGSYVTLRAGDQPVVVLRDEHGELHAFRNVCRHRASQLLTGSGRCKQKAIRCRYHGWTYRMDGTLIGVPEGRSITCLDKSKLGLFPARVEELCGLVFVNLDMDATPLRDRVAGLEERLARYRIPSLRGFSRQDDGREPANWKVVVDNYLEGYHVPIAHPGLMRLLDYQHYDVEVHDDWVWIEAPFRDAPSKNRAERMYQRLVRPLPGLGPEDRRVWRYAFIYPNTTIDLYPDQVSTWQIVPEGVGREQDVFAAYRAPGAGPVMRAVQRLNIRLNTDVYDEDVDLVGAVQTGLATRDYRCGPLSQREVAVAWFADKVRADLADA